METRTCPDKPGQRSCHSFVSPWVAKRHGTLPRHFSISWPHALVAPSPSLHGPKRSRGAQQAACNHSNVHQPRAQGPHSPSHSVILQIHYHIIQDTLRSCTSRIQLQWMQPPITVRKLKEGSLCCQHPACMELAVRERLMRIPQPSTNEPFNLTATHNKYRTLHPRQSVIAMLSNQPTVTFDQHHPSPSERPVWRH